MRKRSRTGPESSGL